MRELTVQDLHLVSGSADNRDAATGFGSAVGGIVGQPIGGVIGSTIGAFGGGIIAGPGDLKLAVLRASLLLQLRVHMQVVLHTMPGTTPHPNERGCLDH
ncbi:MAG: hypothetical protein WAN92_01055 [Herbaspirillum sp.]